MFFFIKKMSDSLIPSFLMSDLLIPSFLMNDVSELLRLLTKNEGPWGLLRSLRGNEQLWANRLGRSPKMSKWANERIAHFLSDSFICSFFAKTSDSLRKPMTEFPALLKIEGEYVGTVAL